MPLKLVAPRQGKSPYWTVRGHYLGTAVDRSTKAARRAVADTVRRRWEREIERGEYERGAAAQNEPATFLSAAHGYVQAGRRRRYVEKLVAHFGKTPLAEIDQAAIDAAAIALHPNAGPGTRNAAVYTPVAAILHHAGVALKMKRPKGAKGRVVTDWLTPEDAFAIIAAAAALDPELALLLRFLLYTGVRLGEALQLDRQHVHLERSRACIENQAHARERKNDATAWIHRGKGGAASDVRLREDLAGELAAHLEASAPRRRVFRFHQGGHLKHQLVRAKLAALGLPCPARRPTGWQPPAYRFAWVNFHSFRHTWATWMRRYGGADVKDLVATANWRDERSASRYSHAVARDAWDRVERLPDAPLPESRRKDA